MNKRNGETTGLALTEIMTRLAAIQPEQFVAPPLTRSANAHFVATASDETKRLFTLRVILGDECASIRKEGKDIAVKSAIALAEKLGGGITYRDLMRDPTFLLQKADRDMEKVMKETAAELERIEDRFGMTEDLGKIVNGIFWREVRLQHPDLTNKPTIGIYSDWSLCWKEEMSASEMLIGSGGLAALHELLTMGGGR
jgi:hypothetical protein